MLRHSLLAILFAALFFAFTPVAAAQSKLNNGNNYRITDPQLNQTGTGKVTNSGNTFTYTPTGGSAQVWTWDADESAYRNGDWLWKFSNVSGEHWKYQDDDPGADASDGYFFDDGPDG